ncbi:hypothetical protein Rsub_08494 [Raphidocelis subcapitata]|uniref:Uncharacterized protein n=1 Tax=Raphidocelis subcapitata TaxID=307507 RepID=A0A2V0PDB6_9CHLO|nr:hypothetical protein Rsub_08494 [Raphidocelis subcapitata]|eukprot:GBF95903.1 hypothetical protein Rsub_08494 [Raphidocelis subcapitata]
MRPRSRGKGAAAAASGPQRRAVTAAAFAVTLLCALAPAAAARPFPSRGLRRLAGYIGSHAGMNIEAANDTKSAIEEAVRGTSYDGVYRASKEGFVDADAAVYPEDALGQFWLTTGHNLSPVWKPNQGQDEGGDEDMSEEAKRAWKEVRPDQSAGR